MFGYSGEEDSYICDHTIDGSVFIPVSLHSYLTTSTQHTDSL